MVLFGDPVKPPDILRRPHDYTDQLRWLPIDGEKHLRSELFEDQSLAAPVAPPKRCVAADRQPLPFRRAVRDFDGSQRYANGLPWRRSCARCCRSVITRLSPIRRLPRRPVPAAPNQRHRQQDRPSTHSAHDFPFEFHRDPPNTTDHINAPDSCLGNGFYIPESKETMHRPAVCTHRGQFYCEHCLKSPNSAVECMHRRLHIRCEM